MTDNNIFVEKVENEITVERIENVVEVSSVGPQGPQGRGILHGNGSPSNEIGIDGEFYIDTVINKIYGPKTLGEWGEPVSLGGTYTHIQDIASSTWVINHNLEYYPNVEIVNSAGVSVIGDYQFINPNVVVATFADPFAGKAYLS
jgi:hypothetical protein